MHDTIYCANAGDTRAVMSVNGLAHDLSFDHKPNDPFERNRIENNGAYVEDNRINGKLNVSRSLGDFEYKERAPSRSTAKNWFKHN